MHKKQYDFGIKLSVSRDMIILWIDLGLMTFGFIIKGSRYE